MKSPIDELIIDLILQHYNILSLEGKKTTLTSEEFDEIVKVAEKQYYEYMLTDTKVGKA
jgi:hypothetical protein|tara:strand:+ start:398 stop:574 length:177 start_codon:yes stop_codon:yes gene_type:complete